MLPCANNIRRDRPDTWPDHKAANRTNCMNPENQNTVAPKTERFTRWMFWITLIVVLALALAPMAPRTAPNFGSDKINHLLAFATLGLLGSAAYPKRLVAVLAGLMGYGVLIEVLQSFTATRHAEWADLLADGTGLCLGALFAAVVTRRIARQST